MTTSDIVLLASKTSLHHRKLQLKKHTKTPKNHQIFKCCNSFNYGCLAVDTLALTTLAKQSLLSFARQGLSGRHSIKFGDHSSLSLNFCRKNVNVLKLRNCDFHVAYKCHLKKYLLSMIQSQQFHIFNFASTLQSLERCIVTEFGHIIFWSSQTNISNNIQGNITKSDKGEILLRDNSHFHPLLVVEEPLSYKSFKVNFDFWVRAELISDKTY